MLNHTLLIRIIFLFFTLLPILFSIFIFIYVYDASLQLALAFSPLPFLFHYAPAFLLSFSPLMIIELFGRVVALLFQDFTPEGRGRRLLVYRVHNTVTVVQEEDGVVRVLKG